MLMLEERKLVVEYGKKLITNNLTTGSGGNISIFNREKGLVAVSPSGLDYFETKVEDIVIVDLDGNTIEGNLKPSSETGMHLIFYKNREDANAIVHTHSKFATAIACMGWDLKPVHYLIGFAGYDVKCAKYATYGSQELAENALDAIGNRNAVLLGNHGLIALGTNIQRAFSTAEHLEFVSEIYYLTKTLGEPKLLSQDQMDEVMKKFNTYRYK
ncbi:L-fuculose-phosphate aldolase [Clostridium sp. Cult3]|jgi:L-fuculose-phosphate aldolase|uniref:L-fuculose-phosphate aldolase n=1 Tax=Clostridium sp. Cult3 TaxID=2079004 RepID=UPI001F45C1E5|nr:L-fuculose-phosphate aldolase [Clostridium sp. Cult3]MCF6460269.1 fuculose phosphate aldolase [Clostridium sp. Cult3]